MSNIIGKLISLELGMLAMTKDKVQETVDEFIKRGEVSQEEGKKMVDDLIHRGEKSRTVMKGEIERSVNDLLSRLDVPKRGEVNDLKKELEMLRIEMAALRRGLEKEKLEDTFKNEK